MLHYSMPNQHTTATNQTSEQVRVKKLEYDRRYRQKRKDIISAAKSVPCADCGVQYPTCVMDFDHIKGNKLFNVGAKTTGSIKVLLAEIAKCEVVCANCHRLRTYLPKK